jgi:hypothetical protein
MRRIVASANKSETLLVELIRRGRQITEEFEDAARPQQHGSFRCGQ